MRIDGLRALRALYLGEAVAAFAAYRMPDCENRPEQSEAVREEGDDGRVRELIEALREYRLGSMASRSADYRLSADEELAASLRVWLTFHGDSQDAAPDFRVLGPALARVLDETPPVGSDFEDLFDLDEPEVEAADFTDAECDLISSLHSARGLSWERKIFRLDKELVSGLRAWAHVHPRAGDRELVRHEAVEMLERAAQSIDEQLNEGHIALDFDHAGDAYELGRLREGFARYARELQVWPGPVASVRPEDAELIRAAADRAGDELEHAIDMGDAGDEHHAVMMRARIDAWRGIGAAAGHLEEPASADKAEASAALAPGSSG